MHELKSKIITPASSRTHGIRKSVAVGIYTLGIACVVYSSEVNKGIAALDGLFVCIVVGRVQRLVAVILVLGDFTLGRSIQANDTVSSRESLDTDFATDVTCRAYDCDTKVFGKD